jgi:class 3 adenylate cyclase
MKGMTKKESSARKVPINRKVTAIILVSLIVGLGATVWYFTTALTGTIKRSMENSLQEQAAVLYTAIENFMLPGQAPMAVRYFEQIEEQNPDYSVMLFRAGGQQAFTDNSTIREVNANLGAERFSLKPEDEVVRDPSVRSDSNFEQAVSKPPLMQVFREQEDGSSYYRIYKPLINKPKCTRCHGSTHTIRGVIEVRSDITSSVRRQQRAVLTSGSIFLGVLLLLSVVLTRFMQAAVLRPVNTVRDVCLAVTHGDFSKKVEMVKNDEIGELGETVNRMVEGLYERFELSKYVSSSTIESLKDSGAGKNVGLTVFFSDIRGFTSYTEKQDAETVVANLNAVLNLQSEIIAEYGGDIDKYVGDEIMAMFTGEEGIIAACSCAAEIQRRIAEEGAEFDHLQVGIGINTGKVILGMIGSRRRADYTMIGDNVNLASRLCNAAGPGEIITADTTYRFTANSFSWDGPYKVKVKGKERYVKVHKLSGLR